MNVHITETVFFRVQFRSHILPALRTHASWVGDGERTLPDGSLRYVRSLWKRLDGVPGVAFIGVDIDVTDRKALEHELQQSRKLAKIGVLSEGIAHELRNPLSYSLSAAQLLEDPRLPKEVQAQCLHAITTGLHKASLIVENLLSLGKPSARITRSPVRLTDVVSEALDSASTHGAFRNVRVNIHFPSEPLIVHGNHDMLVQVFHNVITNALNEMLDGGSLTFDAEIRDDVVRVRVSDSGPGVTEEQLKHLFDPFFTASRSGKGTGLGLTLSYYIMKEHHGGIDVESTPGGGATFTLSFPVASKSGPEGR